MSVGATCAYLYANRAKGSIKVNPIVDLHCQTVPVKDGSGARINAALKDGQLMKYMYEDAQTVYQIFRRGARESVGGDALGYRKKMPDGSEPYVWITYKEAIEKAENLAAGFLAKGLQPGQDTFIGLYAQNRPEWVITEQACYVYSQVVVPLYDTLGTEACTYIVNKMAMELVVCDKNAKAESLLERRADCPSLRLLVIMEEPTESLLAKAKSSNVEVLSYQSLIDTGKRVQPRPTAQPPRPSDLATVCFTSGTTGTPKGVMLTHGNVAADCSAYFIFKYACFCPDDVMISFLPLAHMFERVLESCMYMHGCRVGFYKGDIRLLTDDIKELRPTFVPAVPRLLNRIYDKVMSEVGKSGFKKFLFEWALCTKKKELDKSIVRNNSMWDSLVFKKVREAMGGRVKLVICGSAPLAENVLTFMRASLGCIVMEGYGQTECVAAATVSLEGDHVAGHVGPPLPCCSVKLVDVPEMGYLSKHGRGEVCIKGYNVSPGYYKDEERTKETFDPDGWLHTGDIGMWTDQGTLKIIDRKKHIFKLSQGEYIAPEKIENVYISSKYLAQAFVHGESLKSCLVAVAVPDVEVMKQIADKEFGMKGASMAELCKNPEVKKKILEDMLRVGKSSGLHSFEQVKDIHLHPELFSVENGLLTPTFKSKRPELKIFFKEELARMYSTLI